MKMKERPRFREEMLNCPNCGAPISGDRCEYCGTQFIDCTTIQPDKRFYLKFSPDGKKTIICRVFLENLSTQTESETLDFGRDELGNMMTVTSSYTHRITATYVVC